MNSLEISAIKTAATTIARIRNSLEISTYQLWRQFIFNPFIFTDYLRSKNIIKSKVYLLVKSLRKCHQESLFKSRKAKWMKHFRREMSSQIGPLSTLHTKKLQRIFFKFILLTMFENNSQVSCLSKISITLRFPIHIQDFESC